MLNWFSNREARTLPIADDDDDHITAPSIISGLLKRTFDKHCLLKLSLDSNTDAYGTAIVELGKDHDYLVLDRLTPADGNARLTPGCEITVSTLLNNLQLTFLSTVTDIGIEKTQPFIWVTFPAQVLYPQHRQKHRVAVPMNWPAAVSIWLDCDTRINGVVRDLSSGGFGAQLEKVLPMPIEHLPMQLPFYLMVGNDRIVEGELEICHVVSSRFGKPPRIGTRIVTITPHYQRLLDQSVADIDRQQTRLR